MMSALVAGSAWIWPPVEGASLAATGEVVGLPPGAVGLERTRLVLGALDVLPPPPASAARKVVASAVASAFLR